MAEIPVTIIRHDKERIRKCTLTPIEGRYGFRFLKAGKGFLFDATGFTLLTIDGPDLMPADAGRPLLLLDSTWRRLPDIERCLIGAPLYRRLPCSIRTAYPRVSKIATDPPRGLASIEALYAALKILGHDDPSLLDGYYWKGVFLKQF